MDRRPPDRPSRRRPVAATAAVACALAAAVLLAVALAVVLATPLTASSAAAQPLLAVALALVLAATAALILARRQTDRLARSLADQLAARDALLSAAFLSTPALTLTRDGAVRRLNEAAVALFGPADDSARGRAFSDLVDGFDMAAIPASGVEAGLLDAPSSHWTGRRADGSTFPLSIRFGLAPGAPDDEYAALILTDLTRWHAAEAQARELHAQLNKVWRLNSLGEMAATLAHELNQPLSAATTYLHASQVDLEKAGPLGDSASRTLELAKGQLLRAGQIIRRMRAFLIQETAGLGREHAGAMIHDLAQVLIKIGQSKDVAVRIDAPAQDDAVRADRIQFQQALVNLVRNGVEAAAGRPGAEVRVLGCVDGDGYRISVEDNGPGVAPDQVGRLFQPMTSTKSGGMGLGLSVTRTIVERHGGGLRVADSQSLGGAAFFFTLTRDEEPEAA